MKRVLYNTGAGIFFAILLLITLPHYIVADENDDSCLTCHADFRIQKVTSQPGKTSLYVDYDEIKSSTHGELNCVDCHKGFTAGGLHEFDQITPLTKVSQAEACGSCHSDQSSIFFDSTHGIGITKDFNESATCSDCHSPNGSVHNIFSNNSPQSPVYVTNLAITCSICHDDASVMTPFGIKANTYETYSDSVHGQTLDQGSLNVVTCVSCHGSHSVGYARNFTTLLADNCGSCHNESYIDYKNGIYGLAFFEGNVDVPECITCHSVTGQRHNIAPLSSQDSPVYYRNISHTCATCHENFELMSKYGITKNVCETYENSFHGKAIKLSTDEQISTTPEQLPYSFWNSGPKNYATCTSCHGSHKVLKTDDPDSPVSNIGSLTATCGKCHVDATAKFAGSFDMHESGSASFLGVPIVGGDQLPASIVEVIYSRILIPVFLLMGISYIIQDSLRTFLEYRRHRRESTDNRKT